MENECEKSLLSVGDKSTLSIKQQGLIEIAGKEPLSNKIFEGTKFATNCIVKSDDNLDIKELGHYSKGVICINGLLKKSLSKCVYKIKHNITEFFEDEVLALDTYIHEWVHSITNHSIFRDDRQKIKEILTEYVAREYTKEITGIDSIGGYEDELSDFLQQKKRDINSKKVLHYLQKDNINDIKSFMKNIIN